jgi:hypothetical protein
VDRFYLDTAPNVLGPLERRGSIPPVKKVVLPINAQRGFASAAPGNPFSEDQRRHKPESPDLDAGTALKVSRKVWG